MPCSQQPLTQPRRYPALDGLRGVAILLVFVFHYGGGLHAHNPLLRLFGYLTQAGWIGVNIFFALSGFLITDILITSLQPLRTEPEASNPFLSPRSPQTLHTLRNFYVRRALRIFPLYYFALLACAAAAFFAGAHPRQLQSLGIYAFFLQNIPSLVNPALQTPAPLPVFHLWSIAVEEQFYLLWPFLLLSARTPRRALHLSLWICLLTTLSRGLFFAPHLVSFAIAQNSATFLPFRAGSLSLGAALALYSRQRSAAQAINPGQKEVGLPREERSRERRKRPHWTLLLALTLLFLAAFMNHSFLLNSPAAYTILLPAADLLAASLVALSLQPNLLRGALSHPVFIFLGRISYGFYVFHILLEPLFDHLGSLLTHSHTGFPYQVARLLTALPLTTAAAWLSFTVLERPLLRLKQRFPVSTSPPDFVRNLT